MIWQFVLDLYVGGFLGALAVMSADSSWVRHRQEKWLAAIVWPIAALVVVVEWMDDRREAARAKLHVPSRDTEQ